MSHKKSRETLSYFSQEDQRGFLMFGFRPPIEEHFPLLALQSGAHRRGAFRDFVTKSKCDKTA